MDLTTVAGFDWDEGNRSKCQKHGVTILEIEAVFRRRPQVAPDISHSDAETRFLAIGTGPGARPIFIAFTLRQIDGKTRIRPISARYMHRREIDNYDQSSSPSDQ